MRGGPRGILALAFAQPVFFKDARQRRLNDRLRHGADDEGTQSMTTTFERVLCLASGPPPPPEALCTESVIQSRNRRVRSPVSPKRQDSSTWSWSPVIRARQPFRTVHPDRADRERHMSSDVPRFVSQKKTSRAGGKNLVSFSIHLHNVKLTLRYDECVETSWYLVSTLIGSWRSANRPNYSIEPARLIGGRG